MSNPNTASPLEEVPGDQVTLTLGAAVRISQCFVDEATERIPVLERHVKQLEAENARLRKKLSESQSTAEQGGIIRMFETPGDGSKEQKVKKQP